MDAAQYLRKSRMEEGLNTEEVLAKHRQALAEYAANNDIHIIETYYEVRSGESLYARPEMLRLLEDVEDGKYDAVLVMDLDRLSRGRMKDQGIILDAFRETGTLIVTPEKTYDLSDELDDEIAEMKTFISRREYKIINKRLRRGLDLVIKQGCYVANAPYGYRKIKVGRKSTLEIVEEEAVFVRMMFQMYASGSGCTTIAEHVNSLGAHPRRSAAFSRTSVANILRNQTYIGKVVWNKKKFLKKGKNGNPKHKTTVRPKSDWIVVDGIHLPIIDRELFDKVQDIMAGRYSPPKNDGTIRSPLAGLVICSNCGNHMQRMYAGNGDPYLMCMRKGCCAGAKFELVEDAVLHELSRKLGQLTVSKPAAPAAATKHLTATLKAVRKELTAAEGQKARLYTLLELGEYDIPTFRERMAVVKDKIEKLERKAAKVEQEIENAAKVDTKALAAKIRAVLDAYEISDAANRNALLKSVVNQIWYTKHKKSGQADFTLVFDMKPF